MRPDRNNLKVLVMAIASLGVGCHGGFVPRDCEGVDCPDHGICVMTDGGPRCECESGYVPSELQCMPASDADADADAEPDAEPDVDGDPDADVVIHCTMDDECPYSLPVCSDGVCGPCTSSDQCDLLAPFCVGGRCVECHATEDCWWGSVCDVQTGVCVEP
jgi:hypothetical protein